MMTVVEIIMRPVSLVKYGSPLPDFCTIQLRILKRHMIHLLLLWSRISGVSVTVQLVERWTDE